MKDKANLCPSEFAMKPILIIQNHPVESAGTILDYLTDRALPYQVTHLYKNHPLPSPENIEGVICLGCPTSVNRYTEVEFLRELYRYVGQVVRNEIPYIGICFGAQLLAKILGAKVEPNKIKEIGTYRVTLTEAGKENQLFDGFPDEFPVFHWHGDTFKIPFGCDNLIEGEDCKNQAFQKGNALGLQFHFEAKPSEVPKWCDAYSEELTEAGKSKQEIISAYEKVAPEVHQFNYLLLDNFFERL